MLQQAELNRRIEKEAYRAALPALREQVLDAQLWLSGSRYAVVVVIEGVDYATCAAVINRLHEWFDTRGLEFNALGPKTETEKLRPRFWRYWNRLPAEGRIGIFSGSWYSGTLIGLAMQELDEQQAATHFSRIADFEQALASDRYLVLKFWLHKSDREQKKSLKALAEKGGAGRFRVTDLDLSLMKSRDRLAAAAEMAIRKTDGAGTPWLVVEAGDSRYCHLTVARSILHTLEHYRDRDATRPDSGEAVPAISLASSTSVLDTLDLSTALSRGDYSKELESRQNQLTQLQRQAHQSGRSVVVVFEGWDAAGKGGAIRRLIQAVDVRQCRVIQIAAPSDEERSRHYLWRFWRRIPTDGHFVIFDRSWYGRVLVERVEGFASNEEWRRAYSEINRFEEQLHEHGMIVVKFWLHISAEEQLRRFREREATGYKRHKITDEDWRNREKWPDYERAVQDMVVRTSTHYAPWHLIPANDKRFARVTVLKTLCAQLKAALRAS